MTSESDQGSSASTTKEVAEVKHKSSKRGLIYLSTIPPYMNVSKVREIFEQFGKVGRIYLQLADADSKPQDKKKKKRKIAKKFTEGWVEFEKKCVAKKVAALLNNTQISTRKKSKHYDYMWNIKYLSNFKWTHLHERLAYEKAERTKKLRAEIQLSKKKTNFFSANVDKKKKNAETVNKEYENIDAIVADPVTDEETEKKDTRDDFLKSLLS